jgi:hypothetical protein
MRRPFKASTGPVVRRHARMPRAGMRLCRPRKVLAAGAAVVVKRESHQSTVRSHTTSRMAGARQKDLRASPFCIAKLGLTIVPIATNGRPNRHIDLERTHG